MIQFDVTTNPWLKTLEELNGSEEWQALREDFLEKYQALITMSQGGVYLRFVIVALVTCLGRKSAITFVGICIYYLPRPLKMTKQLNLPSKMQNRLQFTVNQWLAAVAPSNFFLT